MDEFERQFLAREIPSDLNKDDFVELMDVYIPKSADHPILRIRKKGDRMVITKKTFVSKGHFDEQTIVLSQEEFEALRKIDGKTLHKKRYNYTYKGFKVDFDVYEGDLKGFVVAEFEFPDTKSRDEFEIPDFCLAEVTGEEWTAGGYVCGRLYEDVEPLIKKYGYKKLSLD